MKNQKSRSPRVVAVNVVRSWPGEENLAKVAGSWVMSESTAESAEIVIGSVGEKIVYAFEPDGFKVDGKRIDFHIGVERPDLVGLNSPVTYPAAAANPVRVFDAPPEWSSETTDEQVQFGPFHVNYDRGTNSLHISGAATVTIKT
jgi:hypothetical protein